MNQKNIAIAEAYYVAVGEKNIAGIEKHLHPDVCFTAPFAKLSGKNAVLEAAKEFTKLFKTLTIRAKFGSEDQAMIVYDLDCPMLNGVVSAAVLMSLHDGFITKIEIFYDPRPFERS